MAEKKSKYDMLSSIDVSKKTEKKGNLTYLSWAWAWSEAKKVCPTLSRTVYETEDGMNYFNDGKTAWVKVGVTIDDLEHIDYLPIMSTQGRPKSIALDSITSFEVNTAIQRSTTKALALHGLGLNVYAGEDLPMSDVDKETPVKPNTFSLDIGDENWAKVLKYVVANKGLGMEKILNNLKKKYDIKAPVKKELTKILK